MFTIAAQGSQIAHRQRSRSVDPCSKRLNKMQVLERRQSQYLSQGQREADDIMQASQADHFVSPLSHRQMRMATHLTPAGHPPGNIPRFSIPCISHCTW